MKILITGANGYVGNALIEDLRNRHEIVAAARDTDKITAEGIERVTLDISLADQAKAVIGHVRPDVVIHAAALPKRSTLPDEVFIKTNVQGACNIAQAARDSNAKFIMLSSGCAFKQISGAPLSQNSERELGSSFSRSKNLAEQAITEIFSGAEEKLAIVYPPIILHRTQQKGVIPYALHDAKAQGVITNRVPKGYINFVSHTKFAELMDAIVQAPSSSEIQRYTITGTRFKTADFFKKLQGILDQKFGIDCETRTKPDPHLETMCESDESSIKALKPGFDWGDIDHVIAEIIEQNIAAKSRTAQALALKSPKPWGLGK